MNTLDINKCLNECKGQLPKEGTIIEECYLDLRGECAWHTIILHDIKKFHEGDEYLTFPQVKEYLEYEGEKKCEINTHIIDLK